VTGENIRKGMYQKKNWVPYGLDGVCGPATWTETDHRGMTQVMLLKAGVKGPTEQGEVGELMRNGTMSLSVLQTVDIPRKPEWLGW
jgi:branched-chain amino acid transport system substrate-binding protein